MSSTAPARTATRRVGRAKATVVALCLGGSLALSGAIAAHAATQGAVVNGTGTTSVGSSGTTDSGSSTGRSGSSDGTGGPGVSSASGGGTDATSQGS